VEETWAKELVGAVDLHLDLSGTRVRAGLEGALRDAIRAGRLRTGTRLPSSRALAADLGVARNTVAEVYSQLIAEGWLTARTGSGTSVAPHRAPAPGAPVTARPEQAEPLVEAFAAALRGSGIRVETGEFGAYMQVELVNDGPVTIVLDL